MKIRYINNKFDYSRKVKVCRKRAFKKLIILSIIVSVSVAAGCTLHNYAESITQVTSVVTSGSASDNTIQEISQTGPSAIDSNPNPNESIPSSSDNNSILYDQSTSTSSSVEETTKPAEKKLVAITFDDGPSKYTSELVDILNDNDAKATFFLIGKNIDNYEDSVVKTYQSGNEIGIHTYSHTSFTKMTITQIQEELDKTKALLDDIDVDYSDLVRPPYGSINENIQTNIDSSFILWNVDTRDWETRNKDEIIKELKENISEGSIILFHDIYPTTIEAIKEALPSLTDEYEFVTVTEMFNRSNKEINENQKYYNLKK